MNSYEIILQQLNAFLDGEYIITILSNTSSLIMDALPNLNWAGYYLYRDGQLILGPFQGKPACELIAMGKGVCGTAASKRETVVVPDVHQFPGHIACDSASNSEIVVPIIVNNELFGVLDIDSPLLERFGPEEKQLFESFIRKLEETIPQRR